MPSPNATFTEIVSTTLREHPKMFFDNASKHNALLNRMKKRGNIKLLDGGYEIVRPLDYGGNTTYQSYSGYDTLDISAQEVLSAAKFDWKQLAVNITASGLQLRQNSGKNQLIDLVLSRIKSAQRDFNNGLSQDLYGDGTGANKINGLQAIVADNGQGTVGGINSATYTFWRNKVQSAAAPLGGGSAVTPSASTIEDLMLGLYLETTRGGDAADLIVADNNYFTFYEKSQTSLKRYTDDKEATGGFISLKYKNADVIFDGGSLGGGIPSNRMYFLNTDFLELCVHKDANMTQLDERMSVNQDAVVVPIIWMGNLTCSNRSLQGVLKA